MAQGGLTVTELTLNCQTGATFVLHCRVS
jgi:hypothetical protein